MSCPTDAGWRVQEVGGGVREQAGAPPSGGIAGLFFLTFVWLNSLGFPPWFSKYVLNAELPAGSD